MSYKGSFIDSSENIRIENNILCANLRRRDGSLNSTSIYFNPNIEYDNIDGNFKVSYKSYLLTYQYDTNKKIRLGSISDGGYVIGLLDNNDYDCYISAGISNEESFSRDFINYFNMNKEQCFAFDGTIEDYPYNYTDKIIFYKKNINDYNDNNNSDLKFLINNYYNIFLKMDIEGYEFKWLSSLNIIELNKFKQIVIEFHGINDNSGGFDHNIKTNCFQLLSETHYIIHIHGNNYGSKTNNDPDVIEVTYINKNMFNNIPQLNTTKLPINNLDYPNSDRPDYDLNFYPYVNVYK
jgi:hypothetical protein